MNTILLNNHTKFGAKIFIPYRVITFLVLGHFFSRTQYFHMFSSVNEVTDYYWKYTNA